MNKWEQQLEEYDSLLKDVVQKLEKREGELRFDRPLALASDLALQYFCEKKVEMQYLHGKMETESKILGTKAHENLLKDSIRIKRRMLWQKIYGEKPVFALEMLLLAEYKGLILAGRPDAILFQYGFPRMVFEYKFSRRLRPFRDHHVQVRTYGILLRDMGFDINKLFYAIIMVDPKAKDDEKLKKRVIREVIKNVPKEATLKAEDARIYINKFDQTEAERDLDWAIDFWKKKREAIPTRNFNKCRSCEYNKECGDSASLSDPR